MSLILSRILAAAVFDFSAPSAIDAADKTPFPAVQPPADARYHTTMHVDRRAPDGNSVDSYSRTWHVKRDGTVLTVSWEFGPSSRKGKREGKDVNFDDKKVLVGAKLSATVDCSKLSVTARTGEKEALDRIEKAKLPADHAEFLKKQVNDEHQAMGPCDTKKMGPIDLDKLVGHPPGYALEEPSGLPSLPDAKMKTTFVGWHKRGGKTYAVIQGGLDGTRPAPAPAAGQVRVKLDHKAFVTPDRRSAALEATSLMEASVPGAPTPVKLHMQVVTEGLK